MRQFFRIALRVLILAAVFLASALTAMRMAIHGREVTVPKLVGMTAADGERAALANGLFLDVENRFYYADIHEGRILSQLPPAGENVRRATRLRIAVSLGPQKLVIPNVVGQSQRAAEINVGRRGLELAGIAVATIPGVPPDQVVAQSPPANSDRVSSPRVNLLVSAAIDPGAGLYVTPDFVGHTLEEASRAVAESPMRFGKVTTQKNGARGPTASVSGAGAPPAKAAPVVVRQSPAAGEKIAAGTQINFEVVR